MSGKNQVERGKEIVRSLLEFSRERTLTLTQVNFKELVDSAPVKVLEAAPKEQAESAANALKEQDAVVEIA